MFIITKPTFIALRIKALKLFRGMGSGALKAGRGGVRFIKAFEIIRCIKRDDRWFYTNFLSKALNGQPEES
jgi:hypothetical protein